VKVLPEGGVDRMKGSRYLYQANGENTNLKNNFDVKSFSVSISRGTTFTVELRSNKTTNQVVIVVKEYPYSETQVWQRELVAASATFYKATEFSYAMVDDVLYLTHFSGALPPFLVYIANTGFLDPLSMIRTFSPQTLNNPPSPTIGGLYGVSPARSAAFLYPMSDIGQLGTPLTVSNIVGETFDLTSADPETVAVLQRSKMLYLEGLGSRNFGDGFTRTVIASEYVFVVQNITNGVKVQVQFTYFGTTIFSATNISTITQWAYPLFWEGNWPKLVTSFEGRLVFASTKVSPLTIFGSRVANAMFFAQIRKPNSGSEFLAIAQPSGSTLPTDPYVFAVRSQEDTLINFVNSAQVLVIGTDKREFIASGGDTLLSPLSVNIKPNSSQGSRPVVSASNGKAIYYISSDARQVFKFRYNRENGSFTSQEVSLLFNDLLEDDRVKDIVWAGHIQSILILTENGNLYALADTTEDMVAFYSFRRTGVIAVCTVDPRGRPSDDIHKGTHIQIIDNEGDIVTLEQTSYELGLSSPTDDLVEKNKYLYLEKVSQIKKVTDFQYIWSLYTVNSFTAILYFVPVRVYGVGEQVTVVDPDSGTTVEFVMPDPVTNPSLFLNHPQEGYLYLLGEEFDSSTRILVGKEALPVVIGTMPIEAGQQWGTAQMGVKNIDSIAVRVYKTYSFETSSDGVNWQNNVCALPTGECSSRRHDLKFSASPKLDQIVYLRNTKAEPLTIVGINMRGASNDG